MILITKITKKVFLYGKQCHCKLKNIIRQHCDDFAVCRCQISMDNLEKEPLGEFCNTLLFQENGLVTIYILSPKKVSLRFFNSTLSKDEKENMLAGFTGMHL